MSVILILLTASLSIAIGFLIAFIWSVKNGQYDDDYTPSVRMLFDDATVKPELKTKEHEITKHTK
ncbi:cbb3-type cytochrome oxidase assembly protein CcoS [Sphingobacteriaceae bacterium]|nr:cbb3-type cytochrome oxidase assembly protein CcoS [Sphingobacteriaceae bacterium]